MGVKRLSTSSGLLTDTRYRSMLAGYGDFGAMQRIGYWVGTGSNVPSFTNIPQTYQDLILVCYVRCINSGTNNSGISVYANNASQTTSYSATALKGDGSSASSSRSTTSSPTYGFTVADTVIPSAGNTSGIFASVIYHFLNYANTTTYKTALIRTAGDANGSGKVTLAAALWQNTAALSRLDIGLSDFPAAGSTVELFGVKASNA